MTQNPWLAKTSQLYRDLKKPRNGPLKLTLPEFRLWLDKHPDKVLERVWRCSYCRCLLHIEALSIDHKTPVTLRGPNQPSNWAVSCRQCNSRKQDLGDVQYAMLRGLAETWPKEMQASLWRRLSARQGWIPAARARERVRLIRRRVA